MNNKIAQVVVGLPVDGPFDYAIEPSLRDKIFIGQRVIVSFHTKKLIGFVVELKDESPFKKLKSIIKVLDSGPVISSDILKLCYQVSKYYCCSPGEAIETALPRNLKNTQKTIEFSEYSKKSISIKESDLEKLLIWDYSGNEFWKIVLKKMRETIDEGQGIIILVPEAARISAIVSQLKKDIKEEIIILDKKLAGTQELKSWLYLKEGKVNIVIGTRSTVFAPVSNLGLIVMLEEDNSSYKQDQSPFYHARDVAIMRADIEKSDFICVAQSPSVEAFYLAKKKLMNIVELKNENQAIVQTIDISNYKPRKNSLISMPLQFSMDKVLQFNGRVLLMMNKKGFSSFGFCSKCQHVLKCPRCDVHLTYLFHSKKVVCRHCNYKIDRPETCPSCHGEYLNFSGLGIEKLESECARIFPSARIACYDKETKEIKKDFDILIATQAVFNLKLKTAFNLVSAVQIDAELNRLDFQAGQKVFSMIMRLRSLSCDKVIIQTRLLDNYCIKAFTAGKLRDFYQAELNLRKEVGFPPFAHMVEIVVRSLKEDSAFIQAENFYERLEERNKEEIEIIAPQPHLIARLRDQYRFVILLKGKKVEKMIKLIKVTLKEMKRKGQAIITVNVDP